MESHPSLYSPCNSTVETGTRIQLLELPFEDGDKCHHGPDHPIVVHASLPAHLIYIPDVLDAVLGHNIPFEKLPADNVFFGFAIGNYCDFPVFPKLLPLALIHHPLFPLHLLDVVFPVLSPVTSYILFARLHCRLHLCLFIKVECFAFVFGKEVARAFDVEMILAEGFLLLLRHKEALIDVYY